MATPFAFLLLLSALYNFQANFQVSASSNNCSDSEGNIHVIVN